MDQDLKRIELQQYWDNYYDYVYTNYNNGQNYEINMSLNLIHNIACFLPSKTNYILSNSTQSMVLSNNWDPQSYQSSKSYNICNIINYFVSNEHNEQYNFFKILKKVFNINNQIYIYTKEESDFVKTFDNGNNICYYLQTYMFNKILVNILKIWNIDYENFINKQQDNMKILNSFDRIISKYGNPITNPLQQSFQNNVYKNDNKSLESKYWWSIAICNCMCEYELFYDMVDYLHQYLNIIKEYKPIININIKNQTELNKPILETKTESDSNSDNKSKSKTKIKQEKIGSDTKSKTKTKKPEKKTKQETESKKSETKPKKKSIPSTLKRKVWNKHIGEDIGKSKCLCCKLTDITQLSFHCGHITSEKNGGELKMDNLKPICQSCNSSMGTTNMDEFITKYGF